MNKLNLLAYPLVAIVSLAAAGVALADDITPDNTAQALSLKTRAEVQAELAQARADGSIRNWSTSYSQAANSKSVATRQAVRSGMLAGREGDFAAAWYGEDSGSFALSQQRPALPAGPVYAGTPKSAQ